MHNTKTIKGIIKKRNTISLILHFISLWSFLWIPISYLFEQNHHVIFSAALAPITGFGLIFSDDFINILFSWESYGFRTELMPFFIYWVVLIFGLIKIYRYKNFLSKE